MVGDEESHQEKPQLPQITTLKMFVHTILKLRFIHQN